MKKKKVAIITGANSGIGLSTSNHLASKEFNLILCSRKPMDDECKKISDRYNNICTNYVCRRFGCNGHLIAPHKNCPSTFSRNNQYTTSALVDSIGSYNPNPHPPLP